MRQSAYLAIKSYLEKYPHVAPMHAAVTSLLNQRVIYRYSKPSHKVTGVVWMMKCPIYAHVSWDDGTFSDVNIKSLEILKSE